MILDCTIWCKADPKPHVGSTKSGSIQPKNKSCPNTNPMSIKCTRLRSFLLHPNGNIWWAPVREPLSSSTVILTNKVNSNLQIYIDTILGIIIGGRIPLRIRHQTFCCGKIEIPIFLQRAINIISWQCKSRIFLKRKLLNIIRIDKIYYQWSQCRKYMSK